jgi:hypothetical protein
MEIIKDGANLAVFPQNSTCQFDHPARKMVRYLLKNLIIKVQGQFSACPPRGNRRLLTA